MGSNSDYYWDHLGGEQPTPLRHAWTGDPATNAEESRGKPLTFYCEEFEKKVWRARLKFLVSFGDSFVNRGRGFVTGHRAVWQPQYHTDLTTPRWALVQYQTGMTLPEEVSIKVSRQGRKLIPVSIRRRDGDEILSRINWVLIGLTGVVDGEPQYDAWAKQEDDLRHAIATPLFNGVYMLKNEVAQARDSKGWSLAQGPLNINLSIYNKNGFLPKNGDLGGLVDAFKHAGYKLVHHQPEHPGEFHQQGDQLCCWPQGAGYGIGAIGLSKDGRGDCYLYTCLEAHVASPSNLQVKRVQRRAGPGDPAHTPRQSAFIPVRIYADRSRST